MPDYPSGHVCENIKKGNPTLTTDDERCILLKGLQSQY